MQQEVLRGAWKQGNFVVPVPVRLRPSIGAVLVWRAKAKILTNDPAAFYVLFPGSLPGAERWEVVFKAGKLMIKPPPQKPSGSQTIHVSGNARVGMIVGQLNADIHTGPGGTRVLPRELPTIGLAVPSRVRVSDQR